MYDDDFNEDDNEDEEDGVPCEKGRTSKLYIGAKLLLAVGAGSW